MLSTSALPWIGRTSTSSTSAARVTVVTLAPTSRWGSSR